MRLITDEFMKSNMSVGNYSFSPTVTGCVTKFI